MIVKIIIIDNEPINKRRTRKDPFFKRNMSPFLINPGVLDVFDVYYGFIFLSTSSVDVI